MAVGTSSSDVINSSQSPWQIYSLAGDASQERSHSLRSTSSLVKDHSLENSHLLSGVFSRRFGSVCLCQLRTVIYVLHDAVSYSYKRAMATFPEKRKDEVSPCENDFGTFNPEFATELSNKLEHISPRNEEVSTIDMYDDRLHEMTASYSEISFDSLTSPPDASIFENRSFGESPCSDEVACKKKCDSEGARFEPQDGDNKRPDKLELQRCPDSSALQKKNVQSIHKTLQDLHLEGTVTTEGDMVLFVAEDLETKIKLSSPITKKGDTPPFPGSRISTPCLYRQALMPQLPSVDPNVLNDLEQEVRRLATSVDTLTENLAGILHSVSAITVECLETYRDAVCKTCDAVDSNIKLMYQLMAKCEELSKFMTRIYKLSEQLKAIKKLLDLFENAVST